MLIPSSRLKKPRCFGKYEQGHVDCDGRPGEDDPCLLRQLCSSIPSLGRETGFSPKLLMRDLSIDDLWELHDGKVSVSRYVYLDDEALHVHYPPRPKLLRKNWFEREQYAQYQFFVRKLQELFGGKRVMPTKKYRIMWQSTGKPKKRTAPLWFRGPHLYPMSYNVFLACVSWKYRDPMEKGKGVLVFKVYARQKPPSLNFELRYSREVLLACLGSRLFEQLNPVPLGQRRYLTVALAGYERTELTAVALKRLEDAGEIRNVV